jgi:exoribonuclease R
MADDRILYNDPSITTISVDPENCVDVDDAISIKRLPNNTLQIGIHIADPTSYIIEGSDLDTEALRRSESVYLNQTHHMFPESLTTQVFSLKQNQLCRAFSVLFDVDINNDTCDITNIRILKLCVRLNKNATYDEFDQNVRSGSIDHTDIFKVGLRIYRMLKLDDMPDAEFDSKKMIQAFMVYANTVVAQYIVQSNTTATDTRILIRSQPVTRISRPNMNTSTSTSTSTNINTSTNILTNLHMRQYLAKGISGAVVKLYSGSESADRHTGLNQDLYTHFTSPIRRYTDMLVHRQLWNAVKKQKVFNIDCLADANYLRTLFLLNHNKRFYRDMAGFEEKWILYDKISAILPNTITLIELDAQIVSFDCNSDAGCDAASAVRRCRCTVIVTDSVFDGVFNNKLFTVNLLSRRMLLGMKEMTDSLEIQYAQYAQYAQIDTDDITGICINSKRLELYQKVRLSIALTASAKRFKPYIDMSNLEQS